MAPSISNIIAANQARIEKIDAFKNTPVTSTKQFLVFGGATIGTIAVGSLLLTGIVQGILALALVGTTAVIAAGSIYTIKQANPLIQQKIKNKIVATMYKEARDNSLAQLEQYRQYQYAALQESNKGNIKLNATLRNIKQKLNSVPEKSSAYTSLLEIYNQVEKAHNTLTAQITTASKAYDDTCKLIEEKKLLKDVSDIAMEAMAVFNESQQDELQKMLSLESLKQIDNDFNLAMAQIDSITANPSLGASQYED